MIKVLVCDDDELITRKVSQLIEKINCENELGLEVVEKNLSNFILQDKASFDIAVVDMEMPHMNGIELSKKLMEINPDVIILVLTSHSGYIDSAMRISVFRYLSKPLDEERFNRNFLEAVESFNTLCKTIVVEKADGVFIVKTKDILYIETLRNGSRIVTKNMEIKTSRKLSQWEELIDQPHFFASPHKSYLVNMRKVISFDRYSVTFEAEGSPVTVPCVAQRRYTSFKKQFFAFMAKFDT